VKFADLVREYKVSLEAAGVFQLFLDDLAHILYADNPRFSYSRFVEYIERTK